MKHSKDQDFNDDIALIYKIFNVFSFCRFSVRQAVISGLRSDDMKMCTDKTKTKTIAIPHGLLELPVVICTSFSLCMGRQERESLYLHLRMCLFKPTNNLFPNMYIIYILVNSTLKYRNAKSVH